MSKVLMLIDSLGSGGAQRQFVHLAVGLKRAGYEMVVLHYYPHDFFREKLTEAGVVVRLVSASSALSRILRFRLEIRSEKPDTVISFLDTPNLLACLARLTGAGRFRLIVSERNTDVGPLSLRRRLVLGLYRAADVVVANARTQTETLARFPWLKTKLRWIPNCVDLNQFKPNSFRVPGLPLRVLCVGRVINQKNPDLIVEWLASDKNGGVVFDWYGNTLLDELPTIESGNVYLRILNRLKEINSDRLRFFPPRQDIEAVYRDYDLFCLASFYEGTPNVICEAMASGLPVVCADVCDNPFIVREGESGFLFNPRDVRSFDSALKKFIALGGAEVEQMKMINRRGAAALFSEKSYLTAWRDCLC